VKRDLKIEIKIVEQQQFFKLVLNG
jgi:hypothetical protein